MAVANRNSGADIVQTKVTPRYYMIYVNGKYYEIQRTGQYVDTTNYEYEQVAGEVILTKYTGNEDTVIPPALQRY